MRGCVEGVDLAWTCREVQTARTPGSGGHSSQRSCPLTYKEQTYKRKVGGKSQNSINTVKEPSKMKKEEKRMLNIMRKR
jgi:hypothetical protein